MRPLPALVEASLRPGNDLLAEGRTMARDWRVERCAFLEHHHVSSEAEYKRQAAAAERSMQHAHIGFRRVERTVGAMAELCEKTMAHGATIDRFGITLDWTMGYPVDLRAERTRGTGIVLNGPEDFARITNASPAAAHFGDFMLGLPGALENTRAAIAAGGTTIGNLGQYFTYRLPHWDDEIVTTEATVQALGLIAAQDVQILVHSNLDDGFAGLFLDMVSSIGMVVIEKHIIEDLVGAHASFCFGHHFSNPASRMAFHGAVAQLTDTPGSMIFGNTVSYRGRPAANYASMSSYLLADLIALGRRHTGHAVNPVPVTENLRIPDVEEILEAQLFADRLTDHARDQAALVDFARIDAVSTRLVECGRAFAGRVLEGLGDRGVDIHDPAALMLAIRRLGPKRMEALFHSSGREETLRPLVPADWAKELDGMAASWAEMHRVNFKDTAPMRIVIGTTDVHEHGAYLVRRALEELDIEVIEAGVAIDPETLVEAACALGADALAVSTYNGVGLRYARQLTEVMKARGMEVPVLMGGKLNEIPDHTNSDLPIDVSEQIRGLGILPCHHLDDMLPVLRDLASRRADTSA